MEVLLWFALRNAVPLAKRFIVTLERIRLNELRAVGLNSQLPFLAGIPRHNNIYRQVHHRAEHRISNARVTGTRIQHDLSFSDFSLNERLEEHSADRPVFQAAARIREFGLRKNPHFRELLLEAQDLDHSCVSDEMECGINPMKARKAIFERYRRKRMVVTHMKQLYHNRYMLINA